MFSKLNDLKNKSVWIPIDKRIKSLKDCFPFERTIQVYELVKQYKELEDDYKTCSPSAQKLIETKLKELERELFKYYILTDKELTEMKIVGG